MAHPHREHALAFWCGVVGDIFQERRVAARPHVGMAKLALVATLHLAAQLPCHRLHAVANAQHRNAQLKHGLRRFVGRVFIDAGVAARQDDAFEAAVFGVVFDPLVGHVARMHFAKHMRLAHAPGNELGDLRTEVEDEDFLVLHCACWKTRTNCYLSARASGDPLKKVRW